MMHLKDHGMGSSFFLNVISSKNSHLTKLNFSFISNNTEL